MVGIALKLFVTKDILLSLICIVAATVKWWGPDGAEMLFDGVMSPNNHLVFHCAMLILLIVRAICYAKHKEGLRHLHLAITLSLLLLVATSFLLNRPLIIFAINDVLLLAAFDALYSLYQYGGQKKEEDEDLLYLWFNT